MHNEKGPVANLAVLFSIHLVLNGYFIKAYSYDYMD